MRAALRQFWAYPRRRPPGVVGEKYDERPGRAEWWADARRRARGGDDDKGTEADGAEIK